MKRLSIFLLLLLVAAGNSAAQTKPVSERLADTAMNRLWLDVRNQPGIPRSWTYEQGVVLKAIEEMWYATGDAKYFRHIQKGMDNWIDENGNHKDYHLEEYNIDHITPGLAMMTIYRATNNDKYLKMVQLLRSQLKTHPRTKEGGFWHKKIYPWQMWLDGLYMGEPFYAEYTLLSGENNWDDIANQFVWMEKHALDPKTGLLYHGWDESKEQRWANKTTGQSPHFWGRAMGWYAMGLVDTLDSFPRDNPRRAELIAILNREAAAIEKVQDKTSGVWWDILDLPGKEKNYLESSALGDVRLRYRTRSSRKLSAREIHEGRCPGMGWHQEGIHQNERSGRDGLGRNGLGLRLGRQPVSRWQLRVLYERKAADQRRERHRPGHQGCA